MQSGERGRRYGAESPCRRADATVSDQAPDGPPFEDSRPGVMRSEPEHQRKRAHRLRNGGEGSPLLSLPRLPECGGILEEV
jgi:hypothetical protein